MENEKNYRELTKEDWLKIAKEYYEKGPEALAKELGVWRTKINSVVTYLRAGGVKIEKRTALKATNREWLQFVKENLEVDENGKEIKK